MIIENKYFDFFKDLTKKGKRNIDKNIIMNLMLNHAALTRMEIHEITQIRLASITELTRELIEEGYLLEGKDGINKKSLSLNSKSLMTIGIDIQPDRILALIAEPDGTIVKREQSPIDSTDSKETILRQFLATFDRIMEYCDEGGLIGIGISITGFVDKDNKVVLASSQFQNFYNVPLAEIVRERVDLPVIVEDSASLNLICERRFAKDEKSNDIIYVEIGYGVGTGILSNGTLIKGYSGLAGELGHSIVDPHGERCFCGNKGCLRTIATSTEVVKHVLEMIKGGTDSMIYDLVEGDIDKINIDTILKAAECNDKVALNVTDETAAFIGIALSNAVNMLNPRELIFGGRMFSNSDYMLEPIKRVINKNIIPMFSNHVICRVGDYIGDGGALGACISVLTQYFRSLFL